MILLFSEHKSDYVHYIFPYAIWAIPEAGERPGQIFAKGFLPASRKFERFYMCRHVRVPLRGFTLTSENRRIMRKGKGFEYRLIPRSEFEYTEARRQAFKMYADIKFGKDVMTYDRLDSLFESPIVSHVLMFFDTLYNREIGTVTLYLEPPSFAYYYYAFYDLNYYERNLGMYMMTSAVAYFAELQFEYIYLGSCYSRNALYKTQFANAEFFNGFRWSRDLKELKYLIKRDSEVMSTHLLESSEFIEKFYGEEQLKGIAGQSPFRIPL